jgi:hypothetical protein
MNPRRIHACSLLVGFAILVPAIACQKDSSTSPATKTDTRFSTKTVSGDVSFAIQPVVKKGAPFRLEIKMDTHSGDLGDLNLKSSLRLVVGEKTLAPSTVKATSGHHAKTVVTFDLTEPIDRFSVTLSGIRDMKPQTVSWP